MRHRVGGGAVDPRWRILVAVMLVAAACGSVPSTPRSTGAAPTGSSPFTVGRVPQGYEPVRAGTGTQSGTWGEDCCGTDEPYTVLSPDGMATGPDVVVVSITGFEDYQGGLAQASGGYASGRAEDFTLDGARALFQPAWADGRGEHWADLLVVRGDDLAVRVTSPDATRKELIAILEKVEVAPDRTLAPSVPDPPDRLELVGSVDVDGVLALNPYVVANTDEVPGSTASHVAAWVATGSDGSDQISVLTLPGRSVDLPALAVSAVGRGWSMSESHGRDVGGQPGLVMETRRLDDESWVRRSVWVDSGWGDKLLVTATGEGSSSEDELVALAASVQPTDEATWEAFVIEATGGPGLHADEGRTELARGQVGDLGWLLQTGLPGGGTMSGSGIDPDSVHGVDPCLKLSNRKRACAGTGGGGPDDWIQISSATQDDAPPFVVVSTTLEAASVRITTATNEVTVPLVPVPGGGLWAAVVFVDDPGTAVCEEGIDMPAPEHMMLMRVDALDVQGEVVGCLGLGPTGHLGGG